MWSQSTSVAVEERTVSPTAAPQMSCERVWMCDVTILQSYNAVTVHP